MAMAGVVLIVLCFLAKLKLHIKSETANLKLSSFLEKPKVQRVKRRLKFLKVRLVRSI